MEDTVLVTGGAGYIGSHVCKLLAKVNRTSVVLDNLERGNRELVKWSTLVVGDLRDHQLLCDTIRAYSVSAVIHFAALAYVRESMAEPAVYWHNNVGGTLALLDAMRETGVKNIVFSSSCATYGIPQTSPIDVQCPQLPINPYGWTKLTCERMIQDYGNRYGWKYLLLRYFNVAGGDPDLETGEVHDPETHIIPTLLLKARNSYAEPVSIFGNQHRTPDGTCVRDFIHVMDLAAVHVGGLRYLEAGGKSTAMNVGLGKGTSVPQLIQACEAITQTPIPFVIHPPNPGDPPYLIADPSGTWDILGLVPQYTDVRTMIQHAWSWITQKRDIVLHSRLQT